MISLNEIVVGDAVFTLIDKGEIKGGSIGIVKRIYSTFHVDVRFRIENNIYRIIKLKLSDIKKIERSKL